MYADRHARSSAIDPGSLGIAVAINAAVIAALLLANPSFTVVRHDRPFTTYAVPPDAPPPPIPPEATPRHPLQRQLSSAPRPPIEIPATSRSAIGEVVVPPSPPIDPGPAIAPTATPSPLATIAPEIDPAHRGDLQPTYPASEMRAEHEGIVVVRVLVGVDGRVRQVDPISATSDAFLRATRERALAKWRFRPATRGGVPVEGWRTMTIRFVIPR